MLLFCVLYELRDSNNRLIYCKLGQFLFWCCTLLFLCGCNLFVFLRIVFNTVLFVCYCYLVLWPQISNKYLLTYLPGSMNTIMVLTQPLTPSWCGWSVHALAPNDSLESPFWHQQKNKSCHSAYWQDLRPWRSSHRRTTLHICSYHSEKCWSRLAVSWHLLKSFSLPPIFSFCPDILLNVFSFRFSLIIFSCF